MTEQKNVKSDPSTQHIPESLTDEQSLKNRFTYDVEQSFNEFKRKREAIEKRNKEVRDSYEA